MNNKKSGFTLIELLVSIGIIGLLVTISIVSYNKISANSRDSRRLSDIAIIQQALEIYHRDEGFYPSTLNSGSTFRASSTGNIYLAVTPTAPTPNDGDCTVNQNNYTYHFVNEDSYTLSYCLGDDTSKTSKGSHCATTKGLTDDTACSQ